MTNATVLYLGLLLTLVSRPSQAFAQTLGPDFIEDYALLDLGTPSGVPSPLGGVTFLRDDPNTLLIGGAANRGDGAIYSVALTRNDDGQITGFAGPAVYFAAAPNIDGGLAYAPNGTLFFATYPIHQIGQILPGSDQVARLDSLSETVVTSSLGTLNFIPPGYAQAGELRLMSYGGGGFYRVQMTATPDGTYDFSDFELLSTPGGGPEGFVFVPEGSPAFSGPSLVVSEYGSGAVRAYSLDANGAPDPSSRRDFVTGLTGAEGAALDPTNSDFIFSTFSGGDRIIIVRGFAEAIPEPSIAWLGLAGIATFWLHRRRSGPPASGMTQRH